MIKPLSSLSWEWIYTDSATCHGCVIRGTLSFLPTTLVCHGSGVREKRVGMEMTSTSNLSMHGDVGDGGGADWNYLLPDCRLHYDLRAAHSAAQGAHCRTRFPNGTRLGNLYSDPLSTSGPHRTTGRQRWSPTVRQLQILERIFEQDNGAPSKKKIKEITSELSHHGKISETNVYNWFQNRRARSKRKQTAASSNTESEVEAEYESPDNKKRKSDTLQLHEDQSPRIEENSQNLELSEMPCEESQTRHPSTGNSKYSGSPNDFTPQSMNQPHWQD